MKFQCKFCEKMWKDTGDLKYTNSYCEFTGLYYISTHDQSPRRVYLCFKHGHLTAANVHFHRCLHKDVIVETDTELGDIHYTSCLEPDFKCDLCRLDLPVRDWFCTVLDRSPTVRFLDIINSDYFERMGRRVMDEEEIFEPQKVRDWIEKRKLRNR